MNNQEIVTIREASQRLGELIDTESAYIKNLAGKDTGYPLQRKQRDRLRAIANKLRIPFTFEPIAKGEGLVSGYR